MRWTFVIVSLLSLTCGAVRADAGENEGRAANAALEARVEALEKEVAALKEENSKLRAELEAVRTDVALLKKPATAEPKGSTDAPITVKLLKKEFRDVDLSDTANPKMTADILMTLELTNQLKKGIRALTGIVEFKDLFGKNIKSVQFTVELSIEPGKSANWTGTISYNRFDNSDNRLRTIKTGDLVIELDVEAVIYKDGTRESFD